MTGNIAHSVTETVQLASRLSAVPDAAGGGLPHRARQAGVTLVGFTLGAITGVSPNCTSAIPACWESRVPHLRLLETRDVRRDRRTLSEMTFQ